MNYKNYDKMYGRRNDRVVKRINYSYPDVNQRNVACLQCNKVFNTKDKNCVSKNERIPLLLSCGHAVCDCCIQHSSNITCNQCKTSELKSEPGKNLNLPIHIYMLGLTEMAQNRPINSTDPDVSFYKPINAKVRQSVAQDNCHECTSKAVLKCIKCNVNLCSFCYSKLHGKALKDHPNKKISNFEDTVDTSAYTNCAEHKLALSMYCCDCNVVGCQSCRELSHDKHKTEPLLKKNEDLKDDLNKMYNKAAEKLQLVQQTNQILQSLISSNSLTDNELTEKQVNQYFAQLHGVLQNIERDHLEQIKKYQHDFEMKLKSSLLETENLEEDLQRSIVMTKSIVRNPLSEVNLIKGIEDLERVINLPCLIVKKNENCEQTSRFVPDKSIIEVLKNHSKMILPKSLPFTLVDEKSLPYQCIFKPLKDEKIPGLWDSEIDTCPLSSTSSAHSTSSVQSHQPDPFNPEKDDTVLIDKLTIVNPQCFYVRPKALHKEYREFQESLAQYALNATKPADIILRELYIAKHNNIWGRGRVEKFIQDESGKCIFFFIDSGETKVLHIDDIRNISSQFSTRKPFALKCRMYDIQPKGGKWKKPITQFMLRIIFPADRKPPITTIRIQDIVNDEYLADIIVIQVEKPLSIRDQLLFAGHATLTTAGNLIKMIPSAVKKFSHQELKLFDYTSIVCSEIESPESIFVLKANKDAEKYEEMRNEMQKEYIKGKGKNMRIFNPIIGMTCAAKYSDGHWHRGIICDKPCLQTVQVYLVDLGLKCFLTFHDIRLLPQKYMVYPAQALHIKLRDIAPSPKNSPTWSSSCIDYLKSLLTDVKLKVYPIHEDKTEPFCKSYSVCLYTMDHINISTLLIAENHAISTQPSSQNVLMKKEKTVENLIKSSKKSSYGGSTVSIATKSEKTFASKEDPYKLKVVISNPKAPDCIYVADPSREEMKNTLHSNLQDFYNRHVAISEVQFKKDQLCVIYSAKDRAFHRAQIMQIISETEVNVFLIDMGIDETVPLDEIQPLDKRFLSIPRYQFRVKLADIIAPGGSSTWPTTSCQNLRDIIYENENYTFFISKVGETVDETIPVILWVRRLVADGPFDPTRMEMKSISRLLVDKGMAIPIKGYAPDITSELAIDLKIQLNKSENTSISSNGYTWTRKHKEKKISVNSDACSKSDSYESDYNSLCDFNSDDDVSSDSIPMPPEKSEWKPALKIEQESFTAIPTYVDNDCFVYLHPKIPGAEIMKFIETELDKRYSKRSIKPYDTFWEVGDICIAQYHANLKWYRAQITKIIDDSNVQVKFVDYGNVEECEIGTLKKRIILADVPIQATKCFIYGLYPNSPSGTWSTTDLDKIHGALVDKECEVTVLRNSEASPENLCIRVTVKNPTVCDLLTYLSKFRGMDIQNINESFEDSASLTNSIMYKTAQKNHQDLDHTDCDVLIEGYLRNCEEYRSEFPQLGSDFPEPLTCDLKKIKNQKSTRTNSETAGMVSSIDSLSWNDMTIEDPRLVTSTPHVELNSSKSEEVLNNSKEETPSSSVEESTSVSQHTYLDIIDYLTNVDLIQMDFSSITRKGLKKWELEFLGHVTGGSETIKKYNKKYKEMEKEIQVTAKDQPIIKNHEINMPCYALYEVDKKWYRGLITKYQVKPCGEIFNVTVKYVDFGNSADVKDLANIRKIHEKWMSLPRMAVTCLLHNLIPTCDLARSKLAMRVVRFYDNATLFARVQERNNHTLTVDLFYDEDCEESATSTLLEEGLFEIKTEEDYW